MKKIINNASDVVSECLKGLARANPQLCYTEQLEVISCKSKTPNKVGVVSGGGSGHEPAHAGYVGKGMLDAAVAGNFVLDTLFLPKSRPYYQGYPGGRQRRRRFAGDQKLFGRYHEF